MVEVSVCIGSACHLKGSHPIVEKLSKKIADAGLQDKVELKGSFCMGDCVNGVCMTVNGKKIRNMTAKDVDSFFESEILPLL